ncbi:MAG: hypothetical protein E7300_01065 [Lachnospiraceae bacterium]|nr:hypothetical protein [Lachnospiraceae bacterium]
MNDTNDVIKRRFGSIKSVVTLILTIVFAFLSCTGIIDGEKYMTVYTVVIAFYFGTQATKEK